MQTGGSVQFTVSSNDILNSEQLKLVDVTAGNSVIASGGLGCRPSQPLSPAAARAPSSMQQTS
jgi:hypothetical protein